MAFYDGLGQRVQSRSLAADLSQHVVADTLYDPLGRVAQTFVPTFTITLTTFGRSTG